MSQERVLFNHPGGIRVSTTRAYLGGRTYAMSNITSVGRARTPASRGTGYGLLFVGGCLALIALASGSGEVFVVAAVVLILGFLGVTVPKDTHHVNLGSASGETEALSSTDAELVNEIVEALNQAIILRG